MAKKTDDDVDDLTTDLVNNLAHDRARLSNYLDKMVAAEDPLCAEVVAKLFDSLTRQNQLKIEIIKAKAKSSPKPKDEGPEATFGDIGNPFIVEEENN